MSISALLLVGIAAGLHAALYGAYKDSPHESFLLRRFIREPVISSAVAITMGLWHLAEGESLFTLYVTIFAVARLITEFWKLFLRVEPQDFYRIPTQIHWVKGVVHNPAVRLLMGSGMLASVYGFYVLCRLLPDSFPWALTGVIVGGGIGLMEAVGGAYKDGSIEGFSFYKFLKSPTFGALSGLLISYHTESLVFLLLGSLGSLRMFNELVFKMIVRGYTPGKFASMTGPFHEWMSRRRLFLPPYAATWCIYVILYVRLTWPPLS